MDWWSLVTLAAGAVLATGGGWLSQRWSAKEAKARELRDREHERYVWARDLRYEAHINFMQAFDELFRAAMMYADMKERYPEATAVDTPSYLQLSAVTNKLMVLRLVCELTTYEMATRAAEVLVDFVVHLKDGRTPSDGIKARASLQDYLGAVRAESRLEPMEAAVPPPSARPDQP